MKKTPFAHVFHKILKWTILFGQRNVLIFGRYYVERSDFLFPIKPAAFNHDLFVGLLNASGFYYWAT